MNSMKKRCLAALVLSGTVIFSSNAEEPVCHHCEEIREYNAKYHQNFEYYDDYIKTEKNGKLTISKDPTNSKIPSKETKKIFQVDSGSTSTDSSGVKTIPSSTTSAPSTSVSAPPSSPVNQPPNRSLKKN